MKTKPNNHNYIGIHFDLLLVYYVLLLNVVGYNRIDLYNEKKLKDLIDLIISYYFLLICVVTPLMFLRGYEIPVREYTQIRNQLPTCTIKNSDCAWMLSLILNVIVAMIWWKRWYHKPHWRKTLFVCTILLIAIHSVKYSF